MEEEKVIIPEEISEDELLPDTIDTIPLEKETTKVVNQIVKAESVAELKEYTDMFSLNLAKKNAVRIAKLQNLLDLVNEQAINRFEKHSDEFSNKEIIDYMKAVQEQIVSSAKTIESIDEKPLTQINNTKTEVNINVDSQGLSRESKARVLDAVDALVNHIKAENVDNSVNK